ncbi:MAG: SLC13 family permease [Mycobacterium sp.]
MSPRGLADALAPHWVVFAVLGAIFAVMVMIAALRRGHADDGTVPVSTVVGWVTVFLVPPMVGIAVRIAGFGVPAALFTSFLAAVVLLWVFSLVEEFVPALVAVVAALFVGLAPPNVALAGFSSPTLLLLLGVYALSAVISSSGLSYRLMLRLLLLLPDKPFWQQFTLFGYGYAISPMMPSTNTRVSLLMPMYQDMVTALRLPKRGPAITALLAAMFGGAVIIGPMMVTSKSANIAALTLLPAQTQAEFNGLFWLVAAAVAAVGMTTVHLAVLPRLFPIRDQAALPRAEIRDQLADLGPTRPAEWIAAGGSLFFLIGCATVSWHHVMPAYLAGYVLLALLLSGTLLRKDFRNQIDWPMIFFLLGADSLIRIMNYLGLDRALARITGQVYGFVSGSLGLFILAALITTLAIRLAVPVIPGMLTSVTVLLPVAATQGINLWIAVFCAAVFSDISFFRYQGSNGILQFQSAGLFDEVDERGFLRYHMLMNAARVAVVYASIPWWSWLGLL